MCCGRSSTASSTRARMVPGNCHGPRRPRPGELERVRPRLSAGVRLTYDHVRGQMALLHPEGVALLNATAGTTLALLDGRTSVAASPPRSPSGSVGAVKRRSVVPWQAEGRPAGGGRATWRQLGSAGQHGGHRHRRPSRGHAALPGRRAGMSRPRSGCSPNSLTGARCTAPTALTRHS